MRYLHNFTINIIFLIISKRVYHNDILPINNHTFHNYVHLIYPDELKIKEITESDKYKSASYLDILIDIASNDRLTTTQYNKRDDFDFSIVNFPFLCSNIPLSYAYGIYISTCSWFRQEQVLHMMTFQNQANSDKQVDVAGL
jgi:hypothetical protein